MNFGAFVAVTVYNAEATVCHFRLAKEEDF
jgi:hypothetical protein